jgi:hypothetical protein
MIDLAANLLNDCLSKIEPPSTSRLIFDMDSGQLARYIEETNGISKPWLLLQLRLIKLKERRESTPPEEYQREVEELHRVLMGLGEWWVGIEDEVFNP